MADDLMIPDPVPVATMPPLSAAAEPPEGPASLPPEDSGPHGGEPAHEEPPSEASSGPPAEKPPETPDGSGGSPDGAGELPSNKHWYVVKVQSGREESIKDAIERRVKIEGLEEFFGQVIIPVERVTEMRNGKRVQREQKLYPGYLMVEVEFNDRILYLFRETSGVGDFVGGGLNRAPTPMTPRE